MKIPVEVRIYTERSSIDPSVADSGAETERSSAVAYGVLQRTRNGLQCRFGDGDGDGSVTTLSALGDKLVSVNKIGDQNSLMVFEQGRSHNCVYFNGYLPMQLKVSTNSVENGLTEQGGKINIDYCVHIVGNVAEHTKMTFSVIPSENIVS
ncbi:MAG: DUF1934 domain-containing protein [Clostridiales bacterium]|nr:DUF1934 domain-containing protein [Clostridiales bacterium]